MNNLINSIYLKHDTSLKSLTKRTLSQLIIKVLYFNAKKNLTVTEIINDIKKYLDIKFTNKDIEDALKHLSKIKKIHPSNGGYELNSTVRKEVQNADSHNVDLHSNVVNFWFSESRTFKSDDGYEKVKDWFVNVLIEFFSIYRNEWMLDVASEQKRSKKKFEFESLFKKTFRKVKVEKEDWDWLKKQFFSFFESNRIEDNEIFWNYGTSAFASTLLTAKCYADKGAIENFENTTIVLDTNILMVLELEGYEYNSALKGIAKAFKKMNSSPIYFNISKEEYARALNPKREYTITAMNKYGYDIIAESDCDFVRTAIKRGCKEVEDFDVFFTEISDVPETFCDEVDLKLLDNKDLLNIYNTCENDVKMCDELDSINVRRTKRTKRETPRKHDLALLKSAEHLRKSGEKCIILTRDGTIREYANSNVLRDETPLAIGLDSLIQLLAIENGGVEQDSTEYTTLFNKIVKSSFALPKESYQVEDLQFMIQTKIKIEELDNDKKIQIAKKVNLLRINGHADEDIILEIQREFQSGIKDLKHDYEVLSAEKSALKSSNEKMSSEKSSMEKELRNAEFSKIIRKLKIKVLLNWGLLLATPIIGTIVGYLISQNEDSNNLLNYGLSILTGVIASIIMLVSKIKLTISNKDKESINEQVSNRIEKIKLKN
jgi:hypothetical protein